ncbi:phosphoribosylanthranilate isomerase [Saccharicrinis carchari]|uniref:N-(5'-phosphoribosyl)anthranilate isomerase n=2 Tax=Saccharicrinis carchari TaxID=1168039 RepID=A0A521DIP4_SACCC|nr:phosphoribosylanthranilate isomerase [Saccharicrinis carchari]
MRDATNIQAIAELNPDYLGFIFYPKSPRYLDTDFAPEIIHHLPQGIKRTGVFVNTTEQIIKDAVIKYGLHAVQLHGNESPEFCLKAKQMGVEVIKAFQIDEHFDFNTLSNYTKACDFYLFDTKTKAYGGSGQKFDWRILEKYDKQKPIFLSGGITAEDVPVILNLPQLNIYAVDINSKFEIKPGLKDVDLVKGFIRRMR